MPPVKGRNSQVLQGREARASLTSLMGEHEKRAELPYLSHWGRRCESYLGMCKNKVPLSYSFPWEAKG